MRRSVFVIAFLFFMCGCTTDTKKLSGDFVGQLQFPDITYHIYINAATEPPRILNATFKGEPFNLDTIWFNNDSLYFRLNDFFSEYKGHYDRKTNRITGQWYDEDTLAHPLDFVSARADTISGLHPRITPYYYQQPELKEDGLDVSTPSSQLIEQASLDSLMEKIIQGRYADIHSLLIARNDSLLLEEYFFRFDREFVYNIQSATKSIVSALTGIAIGKGEIKSVDETLCSYMKGYKELVCNEQNRDLTLRQLLTMDTGIPWSEQTYDYGDERNSLSVAANERDQFVYLLSLPRTKPDSSTFAYNSLNHLVINAVLRDATHLENKQELNERLLIPLGIEKSYIGEPTPMGVIGDIGLRPRDMLKFGLLYMNNGRWKEQQIVPAGWVKESTSPKIYPTSTLGYGYFWWTRDFIWKGKTISGFFAWGYGGQYIIVIPEVRMVVVMSGSHWGTNPEDQMVDMMGEILSGVR